MRLFFALWPPRESARALAEWAVAVQRATGGRATAEPTIHLTLAFLGDADPAKASAAARRVRAKAFELPIDTSQYWRHNKIVWVGPQAMPPELADLVAQLHGALRADGFVLESRPFAAHITLVRKANTPQSLPPLPTVQWPASEFSLVRSLPSNTGARYESIDRYALAPG